MIFLNLFFYFGFIFRLFGCILFSLVFLLLNIIHFMVYIDSCSIPMHSERILVRLRTKKYDAFSFKFLRKIFISLVLLGDVRIERGWLGSGALGS